MVALARKKRDRASQRLAVIRFMATSRRVLRRPYVASVVETGGEVSLIEPSFQLVIQLIGVLPTSPFTAAANSLRTLPGEMSLQLLVAPAIP
jgi:hypothetical protein